MKTYLLFALIAWSIAPLAAQNLTVKINWRIKNLDGAWISDLREKTRDTHNLKPIKGVTTMPSFVVDPGETANVNIVRWVFYSSDLKGSEYVPCGILFSLSSEIVEGKIKLAGRVTLRRSIRKNQTENIIAVRFKSEDLSFSGVFEDGRQTIVQCVGKDEGASPQLLITATLVGADGRRLHPEAEKPKAGARQPATRPESKSE